MGSLYDIIRAFEEGKSEYETIASTAECADFVTEEEYFKDKYEGKCGCIIAEADNLEYMDYLLKKKHMAGKLQLIYVDPPFFSRSKYSASMHLDSPVLGKSSLIKADAYDDYWSKDICKYLKMLTVRLFMMKKLLSDTGCIVVHLDWHVVHYIKIILDQIFGESNFINEIIWTYKSGGTGKRSFARKHDTLLLYGKGKDYKFNCLTEKSYNRGFKPYRFKGVEEFCDDMGWYTNVNMKDVWSIDMVGRTSSERTGYATQKPGKLMERIIEACSDEGDLCSDFFAGSGSFGAVCSSMNRKSIMCDGGKIAISDQIMRLGAAGENFSVKRKASEFHGETKITPSSGKVKVSCLDDELILKGYIPDKGVIECSNREEVSKYIQNDSLSLIKFWSIDFNPDGCCHRADSIIPGDERSVRAFADSADLGEIGITGYDVFGNRFSKLIKCK